MKEENKHIENEINILLNKKLVHNWSNEKFKEGKLNLLNKNFKFNVNKLFTNLSYSNAIKTNKV